MGTGFLTDEEIVQLGEALRDTIKNLYGESRRRFPGRRIQDEDWDRLRLLAGVFRCEHCEAWCDIAQESGTDDICDDCEVVMLEGD